MPTNVSTSDPFDTGMVFEPATNSIVTQTTDTPHYFTPSNSNLKAFANPAEGS